jgi:hypothetical protein
MSTRETALSKPTTAGEEQDWDEKRNTAIRRGN